MALYSAQRTIFNINLQLAMLSGKPYTIKPNTTLNQQLDIEQNTELPIGKYPLLEYFCIGSGGKGSIDVDTELYPYTEHGATDGTLFRLQPFILKAPGEDIPVEYRDKYRLRKTLTVNGTDYTAYYLRRFDTEKDIKFNNDIMQVNTIGEDTILDILGDDSNFLNPKPRNKADNVIGENSSYVVGALKYILRLDGYEVKEIKNACKILGYPELITEIGLCTGCEQVTQSGLEAVGVQVGFHVDMTIDLSIALLEEDLTRIVEVGGQAPLLI